MNKDKKMNRLDELQQQETQAFIDNIYTLTREEDDELNALDQMYINYIYGNGRSNGDGLAKQATQGSKGQDGFGCWSTLYETAIEAMETRG